MGVMINDLPADSYRGVGGIGNSQSTMNSVSIAYGGGVRVGLEDNIWFAKKSMRLASNTDLLKRIHILIKANGRQFPQSLDVRKMLGLEAGNGIYGKKRKQAGTLDTQSR